MFEIHFAPVQGATDAPYRHFHATLYPEARLTYYTPFIRLEKGEIRKRDWNDAFPPLNDGCDLVPQVIFRDEQELSTLVARLTDAGCRRIDVNMGCPFPLQTARGRGAATIARPECAAALKAVVEAHPEVEFSVKMRLGLEDNREWEQLMPTLNSLPLRHVTLHPRVAKQQYGGEVDLEAFAEFIAESKNPVIYNGDLRSPADIQDIANRFPGIRGVMLGRGLLGRPSLAAEYAAGEEWQPEERIRRMLDFHRRLFTHYQENLIGGDHQVLEKIKPFWEYAEAEIGRKPWKLIKKAQNLAKYHTAVASIP